MSEGYEVPTELPLRSDFSLKKNTYFEVLQYAVANPVVRGLLDRMMDIYSSTKKYVFLSFFFPLVYSEMSLFPSIFFVPLPLSLCMESVCVCVFFPSILDIKFVGRTSRGHTGGRSHRNFIPPSFCGACLDFCREKDSAIPFPRRP